MGADEMAEILGVDQKPTERWGTSSESTNKEVENWARKVRGLATKWWEDPSAWFDALASWEDSHTAMKANNSVNAVLDWKENKSSSWYEDWKDINLTKPNSSWETVDRGKESSEEHENDSEKFLPKREDILAGMQLTDEEQKVLSEKKAKFTSEWSDEKESESKAREEILAERISKLETKKDENTPSEFDKQKQDLIKNDPETESILSWIDDKVLTEFVWLWNNIWDISTNKEEFKKVVETLTAKHKEVTIENLMAVSLNQKLEADKSIPEEKKEELRRAEPSFLQRFVNNLAWAFSDPWYNDAVSWKSWYNLKDSYWQTATNIEYNWTVSDEELVTKFNQKSSPETITIHEIKQIRNIKKFPPESPEATKMLKLACCYSGLPINWATNESTHKILWKESAWGTVGILNYTIKWMNLDTYKSKALSSKSDNPIWSKSTASWLWQLLLSNIDKYYPSWREWIWDPIEEAVWYLRYIHDRYWNPDIAWKAYWKICSYYNPTTWKTVRKSFKEWY